MTPFQWLSISGLSGLFLWELIGFCRDAGARGTHWLRGVVWLTAAVAIARPDLVTDLANAVGIDRGADFVFYLFVLTFLSVSFYFYSRFVRLQRQMTQLVRHQAIQEARRGGEAE